MESNRIEYKRDLTDDLEKEIVAFLNYREGGVIYLGIEDNGNIIGVIDADSVQLKIKDRLKNNIAPSCLGLFDVILEHEDGKAIVKIIIASGSERPYYIKKRGMSDRGCFIRIGTAAEPMPISMIEEMFGQRTRNSLRRIKSPKQDLSFEQLRIYYSETSLQLNEMFAHNLDLQTDEGEYNYVAYLLSDSNNNSIRVAKYKGTDRVDLLENSEYGYCSLIKTTKTVLDKFSLENRTFSKITPKERIDIRVWNEIALREAIVNAIVHNDYAGDTTPKFEIFSDRLEITSGGGLLSGINKDEFFCGYSKPKNKELMRVFKDINMVEHLGSGVPRILRAYPKESFIFTDNFLRMSFISNVPERERHHSEMTLGIIDDKLKLVAETLNEQQIKVIYYCTYPRSNKSIQEECLGLKRHSVNFKKYIEPLLLDGYLKRTIPEKPNSRIQQYVISERGKQLLSVVNELDNISND